MVSAAPPPQVTGQRVVQITLVARDFAFSPPRIVVDEGDLVKIRLVAGDIPHSFAIDEYRIAKKSIPGTDAVIEFCAQTRGTFTFYCSLTDDPRCRGMKGQLVVR
jgi:heme/copper-type cytochrome/quinol oxidase subunit 2